MSEPATKVWLNFIEGEKKLPDKIQSQLQQVQFIFFLHVFFHIFILIPLRNFKK